jgi:hypothetical protein
VNKQDKKMKNNKINKKLFLVFGFLFLVFPFFVNGFALDPLMTILQGSAEHVGPWLTMFIVFFFIFIVGILALAITTSLLQAIIEITPEALTVLQGDAAAIVQAGWNFTVGIANMLLLLAFVFIAISLALGQENFALKKSLPRLIGVAFLMNFTLLFVGMGIDISNFLFNSIANQFLESGGNILWKAITPLLVRVGPTILGTIAFLIALMAMNLGVITSVVARGVIGLGFVTLLPFILEFLINGVIMLFLSGTFLLFFFILLARIIIIQFLAIFAPVAFFCLIFDGTKKYWDMWLEHFIQWLFVGVVFIFLMYVGLALAPLVGTLVDPLVDATKWPLIIKWWGGGIVSHIVLLVYFLVILGFTRKFVPALAKAAIEQTKSAIKTVAPYVDAIKDGTKSRKIADLQRRAASNKDWKDKQEKNMYAAPIEKGGFLEKQLSHAQAHYRRYASKPYKEAIDSGKEDFKKVGEDLKGESKKGYESAFAHAVADKDYKKALATYLAAKNAGKNLTTLHETVAKNPELEKKLNKEAEIYGKEKDYRNFVTPEKELSRIIKTSKPAERDDKIREFVSLYSPGDMEKIAPVFAKMATDKSKPVDMGNVELLLKQILKSSDGLQRSFVKGGEKEGMSVLYNVAKKEPDLGKSFYDRMNKGPSKTLITDAMRKDHSPTP